MAACLVLSLSPQPPDELVHFAMLSAGNDHSQWHLRFNGSLDVRVPYCRGQYPQQGERMLGSAKAVRIHT